MDLDLLKLSQDNKTLIYIYISKYNFIVEEE
jgi:hypothetical protein